MRNQMKNGTSTIRSIVRTFGRFQIREADPALASALFTFLGYRLRYRPVSDQASSEPSSSPEPPSAPSW